MGLTQSSEMATDSPPEPPPPPPPYGNPGSESEDEPWFRDMQVFTPEQFQMQDLGFSDIQNENDFYS